MTNPTDAGVLAVIDDACESLDRDCDGATGLRRARATIAQLLTRTAELEARTALTMGVGDGSGKLFIHGDYDSIKAAQAMVFRCEEYARRVAELEAERDALRADAELFRWMETHVAAWHCKEAALPRFVVDPRFSDEAGEEYSLIVTGTDGVGTVSLRTAVRMMRKSKIDAARAEAGSHD